MHLSTNISGVIIGLVALAACDKDPIQPRDFSVVACGAVGTGHHGTITGKSVWRVSDSPHVLQDTVAVMDSLTIEAGAIVCAQPGSQLRVNGALIAEGTPDRPIKFIAADSSRRWSGITAGDYYYFTQIRLKHVDVSHGNVSSGRLDIEDSHIRRGSVTGCTVNILRTVVDTGNLSLSGGISEDNIIRAGSLIMIDPRYACGGPIALNGGRVENSPGIAIEYFDVHLPGSAPNLTSTRPLRVLGSRGYPARLPVSTFATIWPTPAALDSLMGNSKDTVSLGMDPSTHAIRSKFYVRRGLHLSLGPGYQRYRFPVDTLIVEPGATLSLSAVTIDVSGNAIVRGTPELPIRITGGTDPGGLRLVGSGNSDVSNVFFSKAFLSAEQQHAARISRVNSNYWINLGSPNSEITDSEIHEVVGNVSSFGSVAALRLAANGTSATRVIIRNVSGTGANNNQPPGTALAAVAVTASDARINNCRITDNAADGIRVNGSNVQINDCNLEGNGGVGVNNMGGPRVDARRNWWGDLGGPSGANGDGVAGDVDYAEWLTSPRAALRTAASVTIAASRSSVGTADTLRLNPTVRDATGHIITEPMIWRSADTSIAFTDSTISGVVVGSRVGSTIITGMVASDTTVRATYAVSVTAAAPFYEWETIDAGNVVLSHVWGASRNAIYVTTAQTFLVPRPSQVMRFDGSTWSVLPAGPTSLNELTGAADNDVFVEAGYNGGEAAQLWHWNGGAWSMSTPPSRVHEMSVIGPRDVMAITRIYNTSGVPTYALYRYHDGQWNLLFPMGTYADGDLFARSSTDAYVYRNGGTVQHWNGQALTDVAGAPKTSLTSLIAGTPRTLITIGSEFDPLLRGQRLKSHRFDGSSWTSLTMPEQWRDVYALYVLSDELAVATGNGVYIYDGTRWWPLWTGGMPGGGSVWVTDHEIYVLGGGGRLLRGRRR